MVTVDKLKTKGERKQWFIYSQHILHTLWLWSRDNCWSVHHFTIHWNIPNITACIVKVEECWTVENSRNHVSKLIDWYISQAVICQRWAITKVDKKKGVEGLHQIISFKENVMLTLKYVNWQLYKDFQQSWSKAYCDFLQLIIHFFKGEVLISPPPPSGIANNFSLMHSNV